MISNFFTRFSLVSIFILLSACSFIQSKPDTDIVRDLSSKRLDFLMSLDYKSAYGLMSPGYRSTKSIDRFKLDFGGAHNIRSHVFRSISCSPDSCSLLVDVEYELNNISPGFKVVRSNDETWIKVDNNWWFFNSK